jgi:oligopeptide transport system substrate-binding protein
MRLGTRRLSLAGLMVLLGTLALLFSACGTGSGTATSDAAPDSQQILHSVMAGESDIATMDPGLVQDANSIVPIDLVFPAMVTLNAQLQVEPWAAAKMPDVSTDGLTYTFHLRSGLQFSDGEPIDANAFAYSINRALDPCTASPVAYYLFEIKDATTFNGETCNKDGSKSAAKGQSGAAIQTLISDSIVVQDAQTLQITLQQPAAYFLEAMTYPTSYAVPQNLIKQWGTKWTDHLVDNGGFGGNEFKLTVWDHQGTIKLVRNDKFWGTAPKLREIDFTIYKSVETEYNAYLSGQNDFGLPPSTQYTAAKTKPGFHEVGQLWTDYYAMNWKMPPFDDLRMRQAFAVALDKQSLANNVLHGTVQATNHIVPQGMPGYNPNLKGPDGTQSLTGNPALAGQLEQAYVNDKCGGQVSKCPPVTLTITSGSQDIQNEAEAALQMWQSAMPGYPIKITTTDFNTLLNNLAARTVQFWAIAWIADYPDPQDWLSLQFGTNAQYNDGNVLVPDANVLMDKADKESDQNQRMKDYEAAEQMLVTQVAWLPLDQPKSYYLQRAWVKNYMIDSQALTPLDNWLQVYIAKH